MQVFSLMDKLVGKDFTEGLANLKTIAEALMSAAPGRPQQARTAMRSKDTQ